MNRTISIYIRDILGECYNHRLLNQWPPVGKSSDTPKEVKIARRDVITTAITREASEYGAGCVYNQYSNPNYMECVVCQGTVGFANIKDDEICEICYLDL